MASWLYGRIQLVQQARRFAHAGPPGPVQDYVRSLQARAELDAQLLTQELAADRDEPAVARPQYQHLYLRLLQQQRAGLHGLNQRPDIDEELIRKYLSLLDLEEYKLRELSPESEAGG
jgi:hypothetical protein